jgi:hypothetical protein
MPYELAQCLLQKAELLGIPLGRPKEAKPVIEEAEALGRLVGLAEFSKRIQLVKGQIAMASLFG